MDAQAPLSCISRDGAVLATAAAGRLDAAVPTCQEWLLRDFVGPASAARCRDVAREVTL
ncbi:MAG: hypothetical protein ACE5GC_03505 [Acidimicrobiia bacterium]